MNQPTPLSICRAKHQSTLWRKQRNGEPTGRLPLGYKILAVEGRHISVIDEHWAPYVRRAFRLAAEGYSVRRVKFALDYEFKELAKERRLSRSSLHAVLRNRTYTRHRYVEARDRTKMVVNLMLFNLVQMKLAAHQKLKPV